jgi:quinohemoprotein ethanol dehydrogenase
MSRLLVVLVAAALASCGKPSGPAPAVIAPDTNWELPGNSAEEQHHSGLDQINPKTVARLGLAWAADIPSANGLVGNPLVKGGVVFQSAARGRIFANDLRTGKSLWIFEPKYAFDGSLALGFGGHVNRGLVLAQDLAIVAVGDCRLIAVYQKTGQQAWEATSCDNARNEGITAAPRVGGGMVFTGNTCFDSGSSRGFVDAFDVRTGKHAWRFYTVPGDPKLPPENDVYAMAMKTWGTDWYSRTRGCGSVWDAMAYDPELDLLYIGTAGPSPFTPTQRAADAGDELFTNSIVAVNAKTGEYVWHFKEVPNDGWNYDASVGIMVATLPISGESRRVVISVPKNGFLYVLDAKTGKFISGNNYTPVNWAKGLDANGRPIPDTEGRYWEQPGGSAIVVPSNMGAHGWEPIAFSPKENLVYIPVEVMPTRMTLDPKAAVGGLLMDFYAEAKDPRWETYGEVVAWDPLAQTARWRQRYPTPVNGGLLHAGGVVFQGTADGNLHAYDGATGEKLWSVQMNGVARGAPSTAMLDGVQYLLVPTGNASTAITSSYVSRFAVTPEMRGSPSRLLAFSLDGKAGMPGPPPAFPAVAKPAAPRANAALVAAGQAIFEQNACVDCHGLFGESAGGAVPDLRLRQPPNVAYLNSIVREGARVPLGMPKFDYLKPADIEAVYAFLVDQAWDAYEAQQVTSAGGGQQ